MKRILIYAFCVGVAFCQSAVGQTGYGVMGVPPPGYGTPPPGYGTPPNVPAYPNSLPPSTVSSNVTAPPPYADPYATAPAPGQMSSYTPQGVSNYSSGPTGAANYGAKPAGPNMVNFNSLEAYYRYVAPKASNLSGANTIGGTLTVALFDPLYLKFGASWGSGGGGSVTGATKGNYDFASIQAGVGFHTSLINEKLTFVAEAGLSYASLRAQDSSVSFSDGSIYVRPALRFTPLDWLELQAGVTVSSADKYDSKMVDLTSYFRLLPMFDVGVGGDFGNTTRSFRTSLRLRW
ncbi:hypothetical protein [Prosthecobacter sp.]|uniref:hypothetical protein n=1 Tax=Prosthecobacter sp. TaxID=1965333 RepID=UPI0026276C04|nr:hypothetical protein [Prosthecobacter sp.]